MNKKSVVVLLLNFLLTISTFGFNNLSGINEGAPKIYLECHWCSMDFVRENITFVNFVRDLTDADIHIYMSRLHTGSGGREYSLIFIGQNQFNGIKDTLKYYTNRTDTDKSIRMKMLKKLKLGLFRFFYKTDYANNFEIKFKANPKKNIFSAPVEDPWNFWVFRASLRTSISGEKSRNSKYFRGSFSASRVTEDWKIALGFSNNYNESDYNYHSVNVKDIKRRQGAYAYLIKSLSPHWSAGFMASTNSSTYSNIDLSSSLGAGVEYDFYPYSIATSRRALLQYRISPKYNNYSHTTIYGKDKEYLLEQAFAFIVEYIEDWGTISGRVLFSNYFHDFSKNSTSISTELDFKLFKGLSLSLEGDFEAVHDQIELPAEEASTEDILLQRRELETQYNYYGRIGFTYTFGSIYNNIVNPRFEM